MSSGSYGPPGLKPPGIGSSSSANSTSTTTGSIYPSTMYPGYGYMATPYGYPSYNTPGMPMMYPPQYGNYYNPYMQYGAYYNYGYPQYTTPPAPTPPTTSTTPSLPVGYTGATTNQSTTTTSSSIYATANSKQAATNTVGGAYSNPFASYNTTTFQKPSTEPVKRKRASRFDLAAEPPTTPASLPTAPAKVESISKPADVKPKTSNLNLNILNEAYKQKETKPASITTTVSPKQRSRSRSDSRSSNSANSANSSRSSSVSSITRPKHRKSHNRKHRKHKRSVKQANLEETANNQIESRKKRFQPSEPTTPTAPTPAEPEVVNNTALVGTMMTMEKEYFRLTCIPTPDMIRPKHVLVKWLGILHNRMKNHEITYEYYSNQLRAIRQDLTVQRIQDDFTVQVYEEHARFALLNNDMNEFNRCQTQLKELYAHPFKNAHVVEFTCYQLLYQVFSQQFVDMNSFLRSLSSEYLTNPHVQLVLQVCCAIRTEDYPSFFDLYEHHKLPFECKHFMTLFFHRMRLFALYSLFATIKPSVSLAFLTKILHYASYEEAIEGLKEFGLVFDVKPGEELTEETCSNKVISVTDGVTAMRNHQLSEKGTKLL